MERDQLTKLQDTGLPMAVPLGADLHAVHTDVPALLVSRLPGRLTYPREPTAAFISALAQAAAMVHGQPVPDPVWPWHDRAAKLQRSVEAFQGPAWAWMRESGIPQGPLTFVHGDLGHETCCSTMTSWPESSTGETPALDTPHSRSHTWRPT
jgi:hypothetical protein